MKHKLFKCAFQTFRECYYTASSTRNSGLKNSGNDATEHAMSPGTCRAGMTIRGSGLSMEES